MTFYLTAVCQAKTEFKSTLSVSSRAENMNICSGAPRSVEAVAEWLNSFVTTSLAFRK